MLKKLLSLVLVVAVSTVGFTGQVAATMIGTQEALRTESHQARVGEVQALLARSDIAEAISRDFAKVYADRYGMTRPEWRCLATIGQFGTITATAIGAHSAMHKTKVSRAVRALEERRWLTREMSAEDRRVEYLELSRQGQAVYRELVPLAQQFEADLLAALKAGEAGSLLAGLAALEETALQDKDRD